MNNTQQLSRCETQSAGGYRCCNVILTNQQPEITESARHESFREDKNDARREDRLGNYHAHHECPNVIIRHAVLHREMS